MAPKKEDKGSDDPRDDENKLLARKLEILQYKLMVKDDSIATYRNEEDKCKKEMVLLNKKFEDENDRSNQNTGEMTRQYTEMQNSFNERIEDLQSQVGKSKSEIEGVRTEIENTATNKDTIIAQKDEEIKGLTLKMETMAFEFAEMLKETLDKMSQRIEVTHSSWDRDGGSKPPLMNRLKEFSLTDAN